MYSLIAALVVFTGSIASTRAATCVLSPSDGPDDTPSILQAFKQCGRGGTISFSPGVFHIGQVLDISNLENCLVDFGHAQLLFSADINYWLQHSIDVVFQDQSTAWRIAGTNITLLGGTLNGHGQAWYDQNENRSNQEGRPIALTIFNSTNVYVQGLSFIQPQFWAIFVSYCQNVTMRNITVSAQSSSKWSTINTDGANTWNSDNVLFEGWDVTNGDDCIAAKGNTTNTMVRDVTCYGGNGMTVGSVGQYLLTPDYVQNVTFENIRVRQAWNAAFIKTWQGVPVNNSTNGEGGGGGSGYVRNVTFRDFSIDNVNLPIQITQCIYSEANDVDCETSKMAISDVTWRNISGTSTFNIAASLHCASGHPCPGIRFIDIAIESQNGTKGLPNWGVESQAEVFQCSNLVASEGVPCNQRAPANFSQWVGGNVPIGTKTMNALSLGKQLRHEL